MFLVYRLVKWVGQDTVSAQRAFSVQCMVATEFFNTSLIILMVNANTSEHRPHWLTGILNGAYYDYVPAWYTDIGA